MLLYRALESLDRPVTDGAYLVASVVDRAVERAVAESQEFNHYAAISNRLRSYWNPHTEFGGRLVLYTIRAGSLAHAFYIMMADCSDRTRARPEIEDMDPGYYDVDLEAVLTMVGERAGWRLDKVWDRFCDLRREMEDYEIVPCSGVRMMESHSTI